MALYKLVNEPYSSTELGSIIKQESGSNVIISIPLDSNNTDYQEYLAWVEEGNTPEAAD
jgi:hypothetical protein